MSKELRDERLALALKAVEDLASEAFRFFDGDCDGENHQANLLPFAMEVFRRHDEELRAVMMQVLDTPDDVAPVEGSVISREFTVNLLSLAASALAVIVATGTPLADKEQQPN